MFSFIDLFAGVGGFHQALQSMGGTCVFASEIDKACADTYSKNYHMKVHGDIREVEPHNIPSFDVLCAGFPCQPFSKAGAQKGFADQGRGDLFDVILNIVDHHDEAKFLILENVRNLADKTENWAYITSELMKRNFYITEAPVILSPSNFGIPQVRERVYILAINKDIRDTSTLKNGYIHIDDLDLRNHYQPCKLGDAWSILEKDVAEEYCLPNTAQELLNAWDEFRSGVGLEVVGYPIWVNVFGVDADDTEAYYQSINYSEMPVWKQLYVRKNRALYLENREFIDDWVNRHKIQNQNKLYQKFEWNAGVDISSMKEGIIQVRQSGVRVKRPTYFPALVAMNTTPIVWDQNWSKYRKITPREAANLQNFAADFQFVGTESQAYKQLGNSVNVEVLRLLSEKLFSFAVEGWNHEH